MKNLFSRFIADESGVTAIEYGLIAALLALVIIGGVTALGNTLNKKFEAISNKIGSGIT